MYSIAVVDDDDSDIAALTGYIKKFFKDDESKYCVATFRDGSELMDGYSPKYDIVFLDIDMEKLNGMSTAKKIRNTDEKTAIIFVTRMAKYAIKGYEVSALDFIVKPVEYSSFVLKFSRALAYVDRNRKNTISLKTGFGTIYFDESEIKYIETLSHYLIYHTVKGDYKILGTLKNAVDSLKGESFSMCNRCYLVNMCYVTAVVENTVYIGDEKLIVSRYRKKEFMETLAHFLGGRG